MKETGNRGAAPAGPGPWLESSPAGFQEACGQHPASAFGSDPCEGQTERTIAAFLKRCSSGDEMAVRCTARGILRLAVVLVTAIRPEFGRMYTRRTIGQYGGVWWTKTGRTPDAPYGQTRLVEPTDAVRRFAAGHPKGLKPKERSFDLVFIERLDGWFPEWSGDPEPHAANGIPFGKAAKEA